MTVSARLEIRVRPNDKARLEAAAAVASVPVSEFVRSAIEERVQVVLDQHLQRTVVPADFFDALLSSLDEPEEPTPMLVDAFRLLGERSGG